MRKAQKQEILEMIQTLHQAHEEIKNYIDKKNYALAQDMLGQCQECAISIGTLIETLEGEGFITVSYAEAYCDVIFTTYEELNGNDVNANKVYKNLKKQLLRIENSIKNDVPVRKEIAFFPYKASMWDSLESVYLAAKKDPNCDVYCVPIPYYDKNPDRSFGQMHYEGREYPKNIEVIDWQTYNFEERKPDVIYIHNPYDDWNLVTSVHPRFYSFNLKKHTEELVYIPYFVLNEIKPNDQAQINCMKHFCFLPGIINADKVIVQSENMRQIYINEYLKAAQVNNFQGDHVDRKKLEEKFLGLGSPKFDKILNTKKEDLEIPQEWLKIIEKADGSWKKIIFYNTSIAALLENNEKMLEKMKDVFRIFKENKDEVALLWRPHPLIKATVSSMRPKLWAEYEKLVDQYQQEGWGIYDNTADMDRAVALSDAYYGDGSSVVPVYQKTGKVAMVQNVDSTSEGREKTVLVMGALKKDDTFWFPSIEANIIFKGKQRDEKIDCEKYLNFDRATNMNGYQIKSVLSIDDVIYFFSLLSPDCWKLNPTNGRIEKVEYVNGFIGTISDVMHVNNKIWIIPNKVSNPIICYDYINEKSFQIDLSTSSCDSAGQDFVTRVTEKDEKIFFCTREPKNIFIYKLDCVTKEVNTVRIDRLAYVNCLSASDKGIYILGRSIEGETVLLEYDIEQLILKKERTLTKIEQLDETICLKYSKMYVYENKLFLIPGTGKKICVYDVVGNSEKILDYPAGVVAKERMFREVQQEKDILYLFPFNSDILLEINMSSETIRRYGVRTDEESYELSNFDINYEQMNINLKTLINMCLKE